MSRVLIIVDMQNDFIDGSLGTKEAQVIVPKVIEKIQEYRNNGESVIFTRDTHYENYLSTNEGKHLPVEHCIKGTEGWQIRNELGVRASDRIIDKESFGYIDWKSVLDCIGFTADDIIELVGLCTDICVVSNALILKALYPEVQIAVDGACCAGVTPETHKAALETMKMCQIEVVGE